MCDKPKNLKTEFGHLQIQDFKTIDYVAQTAIFAKNILILTGRFYKDFGAYQLVLVRRKLYKIFAGSSGSKESSCNERPGFSPRVLKPKWICNQGGTI